MIAIAQLVARHVDAPIERVYRTVINCFGKPRADFPKQNLKPFVPACARFVWIECRLRLLIVSGNRERISRNKI